MKAIPPARRPLAIVAALATTALLGACAGPRAVPAAAPPPIVRTVAAPPTLAIPTGDWRDAPQTPGTWRWAATANGSRASFVGPAGPLATLTCDRAGARVTLARAAPASAVGPVAIVVQTTTQTRSVAGTAGAGWTGIALPAGDPLLDEIAFSRGRFALATGNAERLYLPSWPELSRVIEDCRK